MLMDGSLLVSPDSLTACERGAADLSGRPWPRIAWYIALVTAGLTVMMRLEELSTGSINGPFKFVDDSAAMKDSVYQHTSCGSNYVKVTSLESSYQAVSIVASNEKFTNSCDSANPNFAFTLSVRNVSWLFATVAWLP